MFVELPSALREAVEERLRGVPASQLGRTMAQLSARYRGGAGVGRPVARAAEEILTYAAYRLPATYAAIVAALTAVAELRPDWQPRSLLDLGAGLGAGLWAADTVWPGIERMMAIDAQSEMIRLGQEFARSAPSEALRSATWVRADLAGEWSAEPSDLVLISYVLAELAPSMVAGLVERAWQATNDVLVVVEPGTPEGYARVLAARDALRRAGGYPIAPCPHEPPCAMGEGDWIHFSVRLPRSRLHRTTKGGELGYEDEKFTYVAVSRTPPPPVPPRILRHPQIHGGHIALQLCTSEGPKTVVISKRDKDLFRRARKAAWGDLFDLTDEELRRLGDGRGT